MDNYVIFDSYISSDDFHLLLYKEDDKTPDQVRSSVTIPGMHGKLDMTYALTDEPIFSNRNVTYSFYIDHMYGADDYQQVIDDMRNKLHGHEMIVKPSSHLGWHLKANVSVGDYDIEDDTGTVNVTCDCYPFYLRNSLTEQSYTINDNETHEFIIRNSSMWAVPEITTTANMTVEMNGTSVTLSKGTTKNAGIIIRSGTRKIRITGKGTMTLKWQEGML